MKRTEFHFDLPEELIAQHPAPERDRARLLVVGHSTLPRITAFHDGRVLGIDAGLKDGKPGELWLQLGGRRFRGLADGSRIPLESTEPAPSNR